MNSKTTFEMASYTGSLGALKRSNAYKQNTELFTNKVKRRNIYYKQEQKQQQFRQRL